VDAELYKSGNSSAVHGEILLDASFDEIHLPIGAAASVDVISASADDVLLIPVEALHETDPGEYAVFVVTQDGLMLRVIEVGLQNEVYAEVKAGLGEDEIITTGISKVD
jgi:HlyD family secretion protein